MARSADADRRSRARETQSRSLLAEVLLAVVAATLGALLTCLALDAVGAFRPYSTGAHVTSER